MKIDGTPISPCEKMLRHDKEKQNVLTGTYAKRTRYVFISGTTKKQTPVMVDGSSTKGTTYDFCITLSCH